MNLHRIRKVFFSLISVLATSAFAVEQLPEKEEDIPVEFIPTLDTAISFGYRRLKTPPKVTFQKLGAISHGPQLIASEGPNYISRVYNNGEVRKSVPGQFEQFNRQTLNQPGASLNAGGWVSSLSADGKVVTVYAPQATGLKNVGGSDYETFTENGSTFYVQKTTPLLVTNADGTTTVLNTAVLEWATAAKYLAHNENQILDWYVERASQINTSDHTVSFSTYGTVTSGSSMAGESRASAGFEIALERRLWRSGRFELGVTGGFRLTDINSKAAGEIYPYLQTSTDAYRMVNTGYNTDFYNGTAVDSEGKPVGMSLVQQGSGGDSKNLNLYRFDYQNLSPTSVPFEAWVNPATKPSGTSKSDYTVSTPLNVAGFTTTTTQGGAIPVTGDWKLKGAYYHFTVGPNFRFRFNDRWSVNGTVGFAFAYIGTNYSVNEVMIDPNDDPVAGDARIYTSKETNTSHKIVPGYYFSLNAEYWMTERTGFYFGIDHQAMRPYSVKPLSGRTARVDLGSNSGWQIGIITRF